MPSAHRVMDVLCSFPNQWRSTQIDKLDDQSCCSKGELQAEMYCMVWSAAAPFGFRISFVPNRGQENMTSLVTIAT